MSSWKFWIDVGGTFTDCLYTGPGSRAAVRQLKVLSSSVIKAQGSWSATATQVQDSAFVVSEDNLWQDYPIWIRDRAGNVVTTTRISGSNGASGALHCVDKLPAGLSPDGHQVELRSPEASPLLAMRLATGRRLAQPLPVADIRLGTTRGTNALLTRSGSRCALLITAGLRDLLAIGDQTRPDLFQLDIEKAVPLYETVIEVPERVLADGTVACPLDADDVAKRLEQLRSANVESLAIALMHGYRYPQHEIEVEQLARQFGFQHVVRSSAIAPLIKLLPRAQTTVLDAYLNPLLQDYIESIAVQLNADSRLQLMTSAGSVVPASRFGGKESVLSGPAGGVVGFSRAATAAGHGQAVGLDMGGTSTDVARFDGEFAVEFESTKAGIKLFTPTLEIQTVASGGGSICQFDGTRLQVGPESAGADPGSACYGRGGPLTITDLNVFRNRLDIAQFPFQLDTQAIVNRLLELRQRIHSALNLDWTLETIADKLLEIANQQMASAVRSVSIAKGFDIRQYALVGFGGAAGQHVCPIADELGIRTILIHPRSSVLSAFGMKSASVTSHASESVLKDLETLAKEHLANRLAALQQQTSRRLQDDGFAAEQITFQGWIDVRFQGTHAWLPVDAKHDDLALQFKTAHQQQFGYLLDRGLEIGAIHVSALVMPADDSDEPTATFRSESGWALGPENRRWSPTEAFQGPVLIQGNSTTVCVDRGWMARLVADGQIKLTRVEKEIPSDVPDSLYRAGADTPDVGAGRGAGEREEEKGGLPDQRRIAPPVADPPVADPAVLEVFNNHLQAIATQMGLVLQRTSCSVNVKERLDFSCAVFDGCGSLVVNAPHIPVHLGAMSETVKATIRLNRRVRPGDVFVTNDPFQGGSHLPDITVITPVFVGEATTPTFFVASRSHHAEIGGLSPGSMPPQATCLEDEGVLISNFRLVAAGRAHFEDLRRQLASARYPSRNPDENIADIQAQIAANQQGVKDLLDLVRKYSLETVLFYMEAIQEAAAKIARQQISQLKFTEAEFRDFLDNGARISVRLSRTNGELTIDFAGTDPPTGDNLNANIGIVTAAVLYCLRCLIDQPIPLNDGLLAPVDIRLPYCLLNPVQDGAAAPLPAVAGGNVETSQRVVDVLLGALGIAAASQGTMNNLLLGDDSFGYYETLCGGAGATATAPGASGVHTHMTNTRLTDPEILETGFPLVLREFTIRLLSGGAGQNRGGDGVRRVIEFQRDLQVSLISNRRGPSVPFGLQGGHPGKPGRNWIRRWSRTEQRWEPVVALPASVTLEVGPGDQLIIETPGGGGFGRVVSERAD